MVWLTIIVMVLVVYTIYCIYKVSVQESHKWQSLANSQQLTSTTVSASRGTIYDSQNQVLAQSATVYTVYADCNMLWEFINAKDAKIEEYQMAILSEDDADKKAALNEKLKKIKPSSQTHRELCDNMSKLVDMTPEEFEEKISDPDNRYVILKTEVERTEADVIEEYLSENDLDGIRCSPTTKRFYPQNSLAANVIGHTNYDGIGIYGLEAYYDDYLSGIDGRIITASDKFGSEIPYKYRQSYEPQDGDSLYLNIDVNIQYYLEKALAECVAENKPKERACGIIMNPKTGQVYAMATNFSYDPNNPAAITDADASAQLAGLDRSSQEYANARLTAWSVQWKNKAISELYFPGSVFKVITGSSALEEKAITTEDIFTCGTEIKVEDTNFHCWSDNDHGGQTLQQAMTNSCNPAFIQIGQRLGLDNFFKYFNAFGFNELTGIDLPGESYSYTQDPNTAGLVELASQSFGQTNKITPIQMITAYSAAINGGYLVTPQIVDRITDSRGNIVKDYSTVVKRQVVSEQTSEIMRGILENVVETQPGSNSYIQGYRIGGKSGTSQKIDLGTAEAETTYVSSYCAFAPADDPEVIMLVMVDEPTGEKFYGSQVAAPICSKVLDEVLPYLGFFPEYSDEELAELEVSVPNVEYHDVEEAKRTISDLGLEVTVVGSGKTILRQSPMGASVQRGGSVVLYTDNLTPEQTVSVPDVEGLSKEYAKQLLHSVGLNMTVDGTLGLGDSSVYATANIMTGRTVPVGTAIPVSFAKYTIDSQ